MSSPTEFQWDVMQSKSPSCIVENISCVICHRWQHCFKGETRPKVFTKYCIFVCVSVGAGELGGVNMFPAEILSPSFPTSTDGK